MKHLVITVIGKDRPGLVETLSDTIYQNNGNWLASSLSKLAGQFAGILQVEVASQYVPVLNQALSHIDGLQIHIVEDENKDWDIFCPQEAWVGAGDPCPLGNPKGWDPKAGGCG